MDEKDLLEILYSENILPLLKFLVLINVTNQKHQGFIYMLFESRTEHFQENVLNKKNGHKEQGKIV